MRVHATQTFQPGKCPFHYPASSGIPLALAYFFPSAANMLLKSIQADIM